MQDAYLIDPFSCKYALSKEVLVDVGDSTRVDIKAGLSGVERGKTGA
jgi:hypothetical protein